LKATILFGTTSTQRAIEPPTTFKYGMGKSRRKFNIVTQTVTPSSRFPRIYSLQIKYTDYNFKQGGGRTTQRRRPWKYMNIDSRLRLLKQRFTYSSIDVMTYIDHASELHQLGEFHTF
jgi:hypothetical protein